MFIGPGPSGSVFPVRTDSTFKKYWAKSRAALGVPRLRPHDLRVMFVRETCARGADVKAVQGLLGHPTPTMTTLFVNLQGSLRRSATYAIRGPWRRGAL